MSDSEFYLENGTNIFNGTIDGEKVPRLQIEWRNGSQVATGREGNYINEIGFSFSNSTYYKWNWKSWETVSDLQNLTEATRLYRNRVEYANEAEKLRLKAYETAIEPVGYTTISTPFFAESPKLKKLYKLPESLSPAILPLNWNSV